MYHIRFPLILLLISVSFCGCLNNPCPNPEGYDGRIHLHVSTDDPPPNAQTKPSDIRQLILNLNFDGEPALAKTIELPYAGPSQETDLTDLRPGEWTIEISGVDDLHDIIFHNNKKIQSTIKSGDNVNLAATIGLTKGTFNVVVDASRIPGFGTEITQGKLSILLPNSKKKYTYLAMDGPYLKTNIELDEGMYQIKVGVPDFETKSPLLSPVYPVDIRAGKTVSWNMAPDGTLR